MTQYEEDKAFDEWIDRRDFEYGLDHEALMREWDKYKQDTMKTKMTLFSAAKQGFAVCDCEVEVKGEEVRVLSAVDRSTKKPLDCESVMKWHCNEDLLGQLRSQTPPPSPLTESFTPKCAVPDDCPKAFARFYQDEETPALPNLGWD